MGAAKHLYALAPDEKQNVHKNTLNQIGGIGGGYPYLNIISESGRYKLVMRSDKPLAKSFQN